MQMVLPRDLTLEFRASQRTRADMYRGLSHRRTRVRTESRSKTTEVLREIVTPSANVFALNLECQISPTTGIDHVQ